MNREIKFRAWDKAKCVMITDPFSWGDVREDLIDDETGQLKPNSDSSRYEITQFTGLKDKNGVEVCEGDVLSGLAYPFQDEGRYNYHGVVEWLEAGFCRTLRCVSPDKRGISDGVAEGLDRDEVEVLEVIGNIYENPELLEADR